jgi:hypothetical protein
MSSLGNLECALDDLEAARNHLLLAARGLTRHKWFDKELSRRKLTPVHMEIERIALEVSLILDLLERDLEDCTSHRR